MNQSAVLARILDDPRLEALVTRGVPLAAAFALAAYAIHKTGSTDSLDGFTRLLEFMIARD